MREQGNETRSLDIEIDISYKFSDNHYIDSITKIFTARTNEI